MHAAFFLREIVPRINATDGMYRKSSGLETIFRKNVVFAVIARIQLGAANENGRRACGLEEKKRGARPRFR